VSDKRKPRECAYCGGTDVCQHGYCRSGKCDDPCPHCHKETVPLKPEDVFGEVEYVDPKESECPECKCSFGVHLMTCSKFVKRERG